MDDDTVVVPLEEGATAAASNVGAASSCRTGRSSNVSVLASGSSSVWGGEPATTTPADLMASWQTIVPGFDVTWHELGPVTIAVEGDTATAHAFVDARHWIDSDIWRPVGNYHWDVERLDGEWRVTRMEFEMTDELGDRDLVAKAMERAK